MISIRVTIEGESLEFSSKMKIFPDIWDSDAGRAKGRTRTATDINEGLDKITSRLHVKYKEQEDKYHYVTPELLKNAFLGVVEKKTTLLLLMDRKINQKKALVGNTITKSAMVKYEDTRKKLEEFVLIHNKTADISIKDSVKLKNPSV